MYSLLNLISTVIQIYIYILIASAVLSWLIAFNVINTRNQAVAMIADALYRLTEPALAPIRRILPNFGGVDLSPVALILLLVFVRQLLFEYVFARMMT
jgi:YggT family protein